MIKSILVSLPGFDSDAAALEMALLVGGPFGAHLQCLHVRPGTTEYIVSHSGTLASDLAGRIRENDRIRTIDAKMAFDLFRKRLAIPCAETPATAIGLTTAWQERYGDDIDEAIAELRYHDIGVFGRIADFTPFSPDVIGQIVIGCGRPVLLAPETAPSRVGHIIALAWKDCAQAARALTTAAPLIAQAHTVFVISGIEDENEPEIRKSAEDVDTLLRWHGVRNEIRVVDATTRSASDVVVETALGVDADLLVMGAYGHNRLREMVFGGFTNSMLRKAPLPVLMFH